MSLPPQSNQPTAITARELRKTYNGGIEAVKGLSFSVAPGEIFALLGPNGAGKSTTVRMLATLTTPTNGSASVAGFDVASEPRQVRRNLGYVAQASGVDQTATGRENLTLQGQLFGFSGALLRARVGEMLGLFDLTEAADRLVQTYSGGMKRRLDVAMGLIHRPSVLFLDEPTTGLDPESRAVMWREVRRLSEDEGITILLTTHYLEEADELASRVAIVDRGKIVAEGTPEELKARVGSDMLTITLPPDSQVDAAREILSDLPVVAQVLVDEGTLYARVESGARAVPAVVSALERSGVTVDEISLRRPSLDEVYLTATGHAFHEENQDTNEPAGGGG